MEKLIFVYNTDSGLYNSLKDGIHKMVSPQTYQCSLCKITHDNFSEKKDWKNFREQSSIEMEFYHKDEFQELYNVYSEKDRGYPIIFQKERGVLLELLTTKEIKKIEGIKSLIGFIEKTSLN